ncbi:MAG: hypothetical protein JWM73_183, partial [Solirubrobacterales bacterium]|nr:hypothetical protein [Solirubrobacterales bacterium]
RLGPDAAGAIEQLAGVGCCGADDAVKSGSLLRDRVVPAIAVDEVVVAGEPVVEVDQRRVGRRGDPAAQRQPFAIRRASVPDGLTFPRTTSHLEVPLTPPTVLTVMRHPPVAGRVENALR